MYLNKVSLKVLLVEGHGLAAGGLRARALREGALLTTNINTNNKNVNINSTIIIIMIIITIITIML